jgi:hypothetical protein
MTITQGNQKSNAASAQSRNSINIVSGNIIPYWWYYKILSADQPDTIAITVLSEIVHLHCKTGKTEFQLDYSYFEKKFNFTRNSLKGAFIRLEDINVLHRKRRTIQIEYKKIPNQLFLIFYLNSLLTLHPTEDKFNFESNI